VTLKVRVHGLAYAREIFVEDEPDGGFLEIESASGLADVDVAVARRFAVAAVFSECLARHQALETMGPAL